MGRGRLLACVAMAGCGRIGFDPLSGAPSDAGDAGATLPDACAFSAWSTPVQVPELSSSSAEYGGQITGSGLAYYFRSDRGGGSDFYVARRADRAAAFGVPTIISELSSAADDLDIAISNDELEVYFSSNRTTRYCLFHSERLSIAQPFPTITRMDPLCPTIDAAGAFSTPNRLSLYYVRMDGPNYEGTIMFSTRASNSVPFDIGTPIAELMGGGVSYGYPVLSSDGLTLYFDGGMTHHLYEAVRPSLTAPFGTPRMMTELNSAATDEDVSVTADGLELYFGSSRLGGPDDIFRSTRTCQ